MPTFLAISEMRLRRIDVGEGTNVGWTKVPPMGHFFVSGIFKLVQTKDPSVKTKKLPWEKSFAQPSFEPSSTSSVGCQLSRGGVDSN